MTVKGFFTNKAVIISLSALVVVGVTTGIVVHNSLNSDSDEGVIARLFSKDDDEGANGIRLIDRYGEGDNGEDDYLNEDDLNYIEYSEGSSRNGAKVRLGEENDYESDGIIRDATFYGYDGDMAGLTSATDLKNMRSAITQQVMQDVKDYYSEISEGKDGKDGKDGKNGVDGKPGQNGSAGVAGQRGATGATGAAGKAGANGKDATQYYTYIRYATDKNGAGMSAAPNMNSKYIGTAVTTSATAPASASAYSWSVYRGDDGIDGLDSYTHIMYATMDDKSDMTSRNLGEAKYIGVYTDHIEEDSDDPADYEWTLIKGTDGYNVFIVYSQYSNGVSPQGTPSLKSAPSSNMKYIGTYSGTATTAPTDPSEYEWSQYRDLSIEYHPADGATYTANTLVIN